MLFYGGITMNFTKKSISIILILAFVFTTIVCVSVGASLDFPIHESIVTYNSATGQNTVKADVLGDGKIAFFNAEKVGHTGSKITATATNVKTLVENAVGAGSTVKVDIYAEFASQLGKTTIQTAFKFGNDDWIQPISAVSFTNGTLVTAEFSSNDFTLSELTNSSSVDVMITPEDDDLITGSFYVSVPYLSGAAQASTVPVTSFRTTTTKASTEYEGKIDIHDTPVTISNKNTNYGNASEIVIGDNNSEVGGKFAFFKNSDENGQQQIQGDLIYTGFDALYAQAKAENKDIWFDVYSNDFAANGGANFGYLKHEIGTFSKMADSDQTELITIRPNKKKTFVIPIDQLQSAPDRLKIQFQNYTWGAGKLKDIELIITAPYLEGADLVKSDYEPETTTSFKPSSDDYLPGGEIAVYNNGVSYKGTQSFYKPTDSVSISYGKVGEEKKYVTIAGTGVEEWGGYQIQLNSAGLNGLSQLRARAVAADEPLYMDVYCVETNNPCYFIVAFSGGQTGDKDCKVTAGKKVTLVIPNSIVTSSDSSINITFLNYSEGNKTIKDASFIVSVPYVKEDIDTATKVAVNAPEVPTTTLPSINYHDTEGDSIPLKMHDGDVSFSSFNWSEPADRGMITDSADKAKIAYVTSNSPDVKDGQWQMSTSTSKTEGKSDFGQLILQAAAQGKKVCIDYYGNFKSVGKTEDVMYARMNFGLDKWFGNKEGATIGDDVKDWIKLTPDTVTTAKYDPEKLLEIAAQVYTTSKDYEVETCGTSGANISLESNIEPTTVSTNDTFTGEPSGAKYHQFAGVSIGDSITYTANSVSAGKYQLILKTRDYKGAKFDVYVDGNKLATPLDCTGSGKSYQEHIVADTNSPIQIDSSKNVTVKLVCTKVAEGSSALTLDKISFDAVAEEGEDANAKLAEHFTGISNQMAYDTKNENGSGWPWPKVNYGRFYMSVPYIEGAAEEDISVPTTTTTTKSIPSTTNPVSMPAGGWDMDKIDLSYIDGRISSSWWNGSPQGKVKVEVSGNRKYEKIEQVSSDYIEQIQDCFYINGGKSSIAFQEYVDYAKQADAWIAIDIFPQFETGDNNSPYCYFKSSGWKWPKSDYDFKLTSGKKFTFMIDPNDIPENTDNFEADFLNYSSFGSGFKNAVFYVTAPYLYDVKNPEATTTTTVPPTTEKTTTVTYAYPENNQLGKTRFKILDTQTDIFEEVKVPLAISGNEGLNYAKFTVKFNKNDLSFTGIEKGNVFDNVYASAKSEANKLGEVNITLEQNAGDTMKNGTVLYLVFNAQLNENADLISFAGGDGYVASNFFNSNGQNVPCSFTNGYVSIGDATTRITKPDPNDITPYPTTNSGTTKFAVSSVSDTYAANKASKQYTVYVSVSGNAGLKGAKFSLKYSDNLTFVSSKVVEDSTVFNRLPSIGYNFDPVENIKGILEYNIYPTNPKAEVSDSTANGKIVAITFKLNKYAVGDYPIEFGGLTYDPAGFVNVAGDAVPCSFQSGSIKIIDPAANAKPAKPTIKSVKLTKKTVAKITWKKAKYAVKYEVYRSIGSSKSFKKIATVKKTSYTVKKLKAGKKYNFKLKAVAKNGKKSGYSKVKSVTPLNYKTKAVIKSAKSTKKKVVTIKIKKKVAGATGYQIQYAVNKKFKKAKKTTTKSLSKTIKKLKSKKTYYVRVRTFNKVNGKNTYGKKWSKVKKVKVK